jgi:hypothetical protein
MLGAARSAPPRASFMHTLLSGYGFDDQQGPFFVLDELGAGTTTRRRVFVRGAALSLDVATERYCTGTFDLATYESAPCPEQAAVRGDLETCFRCFQRTGFNPSFYNVPRDTISPQQRAYNERPHVVYLAYFAEGYVKVGISSEDRVAVRWRGQGARVATRLLSVEDAYRARAIEAQVTREGGLPEAVRGSRKRQLLNVPFQLASAERALRITRERLAEKCELELGSATLYDLTSDYLGAARLDLPVTDLSGEAGPAISGVGVGMIGDILVVEEGERQYMLSLKDLIGRVVTVEHRVRANHRRPAASQLGFGFS